MVLLAAGQALAHLSFTAEYDSTRKTTGLNPKIWIALQPAHFDIPELLCSPAEMKG
jgi:hypothetical protein